MRETSIEGAARPYRRTRSAARAGTHIERALQLRHTPTEAEEAAWLLLRRLRMKGFKFRRNTRWGHIQPTFAVPNTA
jgi:very-short-patch-repair endonuclease